MSAQLLVSLSGSGRADALPYCVEFGAELDRRGVPLTLLLAPRPGGDTHPSADSPVLTWVRERIARHDAIALHGFDHASSNAGKAFLMRMASSARRPVSAVRGAEFAVLPAHEAGLRLLAAQALMDQLGLRFRTFVPPRWLASPGTVAALRDRGFGVCADAFSVRELDTDTVHRSRVHAFGPGERVESWWARALLLGVTRSARGHRLVRIAVDAHDLGRAGSRAAVLDAIDIALGHGCVPATYDVFAPPPRIPRPRTEGQTARMRLFNVDPLSS